MEEQKKYFIISTIMFVVIAILILQVDKYHDHKVRNSYTLETNKLNNQYINVNDFGIYLQSEKGSSNYVKQEGNDYPTQGYILNTSMTKCFDYHGSEVKEKVSQTDEGRIRLETTISIYCQMYFDIDKDAPSITNMSISGTDKEGKTREDYIYNTTINYNFSWNDTDVVYYCVKEESNECTESDWKKTNKAQSINGSITVNTEGTKTINAYIRDKARNVSQVAVQTITVDRTAPIVTLTLKGTADTSQTLINGDIYTQTKSITYTANITEDNMDSYCIGEGDCTSYISSTNKTLTDVGMSVNDTEGAKTITINVKDKAGNIGSTSQTITLDKTNPVIGNFTITGNKANTGYDLTNGYTQTTKVNYNVTWSSNDVVSFCINTSNSVSGCDWQSDSSSPGALNEQTIPSTTQGEKTLYAFVRDGAGRVSSSRVGNIKYDSTDPSVSISEETSTTDTITYTITANDNYPSGGVTTTCWAVIGSKTTNGTINSNTCTIKGLNANTSYTIYAKTIDLSGRYKEVNKTISTKSAKLGDYIKSKNPAGLSTGELGGLYRFYGACGAANGGCTGIVDNFICFGTDHPETDCVGNVESEYMYRIIGIEPETGDLKLIKNTAIWEGSTNQFAWNNKYSSSDCAGTSCEWPYVDIFKRLNGKSGGSSQGYYGNTNLFIDSAKTNATYIQTNTTWYNMIKDTNWLYGDIGDDGSHDIGTDKTADEVYAIETGSKQTYTGNNKGTYTWDKNKPIQAKIGLMYIHDFYYSYQGLETTNCYSSWAGCDASWLYISNNGKTSDFQYEWTMSRYGLYKDGYGDKGFGAHEITSFGSFNSFTDLRSCLSIRPVFYLDSTKAKIPQGKGTYNDPFVAKPA